MADELSLPVGQAVRVRVPDHDREKVDAKAVIGYIVAKLDWRLEYIVMVVRHRQPVLLKVPVQRADMRPLRPPTVDNTGTDNGPRPVDNALLDDKWNNIAQCTVEYIKEVMTGMSPSENDEIQSLQEVVKQSLLPVTTLRGALSGVRPGLTSTRMKKLGYRDPCFCTDPEDCSNPDKCPCRQANRDCTAACHAVSFPCSRCKSTVLWYSEDDKRLRTVPLALEDSVLESAGACAAKKEFPPHDVLWLYSSSSVQKCIFCRQKHCLSTLLRVVDNNIFCRH